MREILEECFGDAVTEEKLRHFNCEMGKRFVAKSDYNAKLEAIKSLENGREELLKKISELDTKEKQSEELLRKIEELQGEIKEREEREEREKAEKEVNSAIAEVLKDRKFTSDYVRRGITEDMKAQIAKPENRGKGYAEIFEELTRDKEGIFKNPNPPAEIPPVAGGIDMSEISEETARAVMGLV